MIRGLKAIFNAVSSALSVCALTSCRTKVKTQDWTVSHGLPESLLISLGGLSMHPPTFTHLIRAFGAVHNAEIDVLEEFLKPRPDNFFLIAGCNGSLGYWQSLATRESKKQHQWYCIPKESQVPIHYDLRHHNLCMTERMVHKREKKHNKTRRNKAGKHQPTTKTNTQHQTQNRRQHRGET